MDRKKLAAKSSVISLGSKLLASLLVFICRKVFLQYLGTNLLGVSGTLTQILETLSLSELGFQTAIIFQLYKPLVDGNHVEVSKIMMFLKRVYFIIGVIILVIGAVASPFLKYIITKVDIDFGLVYIVYFIMLLGTASSYLFSYNRALLQADQKVYINNVLDSLFQIATTIAKLVCLVEYKSFILYAVMGVICTVGSNIASYVYYKRNYVWIDHKAKADKYLIKELVDNTKNVFLAKLGGYVYNSTDNLVISALIGTSWVGLIGNYSTITNAIKLIIFGLSGPIQPMLGNFAISKSKEETEQTMMNYGFIKFVMALFLLIPTVCLSNMFVELFYGEEFVLCSIIIILLTADLFIICMQGAVGEMIDALGYFRQERNLYIVYASMNLLLSCFGAILWGVIPVFAATVISQLVGWVWRSVIAYKYYFQSKVLFRAYWLVQLKYVMYFVVNTAVAYGFIKWLRLPFSFLSFIIYGIIIETIIGLMFVSVYRKRTEFKYLKSLVYKLITRR